MESGLARDVVSWYVRGYIANNGRLSVSFKDVNDVVRGLHPCYWWPPERSKIRPYVTGALHAGPVNGKLLNDICDEVPGVPLNVLEMDLPRLFDDSRPISLIKRIQEYSSHYVHRYKNYFIILNLSGNVSDAFITCDTDSRVINIRLDELKQRFPSRDYAIVYCS